MKYKFKIDTPWGKKGEELNRGLVFDGRILGYDPRSYPELFEEVKEKTNVEKWETILGHIAAMGTVSDIDKCAILFNSLGLNADAAYNELCGDKK